MFDQTLVSAISALVLGCCLIAVVRIAPDLNSNFEPIPGTGMYAAKVPRAGQVMRLKSGSLVAIVVIDETTRRAFYVALHLN